jgi:hypothetical protein
MLETGRSHFTSADCFIGFMRLIGPVGATATTTYRIQLASRFMKTLGHFCLASLPSYTYSTRQYL